MPDNSAGRPDLAKKRIVSVSLAAIMLVSAVPARAGQQAKLPPTHRKLTIGVFESPPFAMKDPQGSWAGISVDLWRSVAAELKLRFRFQEMDRDALLAGVADGSIDLVVAPIAVNAERERLVDFSHIYFAAGLGIAFVRQSEAARWLGVLRAFLSVGFLRVLLGIVALLLVVGFTIWLVERKRNPDAFGGSPLSGIASGFWFSSVTFTGVGFGDKVPVTTGGRIFAILWMLASLIVVAGFTAFVTTKLTVSHLEQIRSRDDLRRSLVATVEGSVTEDALRRERIMTKGFPTISEAIGALVRGEADAVVYNEATLKYIANHQHRGSIEVLSDLFEQEYYAFVLANGNPLRKPLNLALLKITTQPIWRDIRFRYLGQ
jgi:ABC-type amino acid transport substrate-binding protein